MSQPVSYEAYREFLAGYAMQGVYGMYAMVGDSGLAHYRRAYALDTTFTLPMVELARVSMLDNCAVTDSVARALTPRRDRLPPSERAQLDIAAAVCKGRWDLALASHREAMALAPRSDWLILGAAWLARKNGRLREALSLMKKLDRIRHERDPAYWWNIVIPLHLLGEHQRELEQARTARRLLPGHCEALRWEAHALIGLGRLSEVRARLDEIMEVPQESALCGSILDDIDNIGRDLRAHGHRLEGREAIERGIRWIRDLPEQGKLRMELASLLSDAGQWDEAWAIFQALGREHPTDMAIQIERGVVAAYRGDLKEVARTDAWLAARKDPYLRGSHTFGRARLAAIVGDRDRAVELYRQAAAEGVGYLAELWGGHANPDFESLRGYPPFEELVGPKD